MQNIHKLLTLFYFVVNCTCRNSNNNKNVFCGEIMKSEVLLFLQQKQRKQFNKNLYCLRKAFCLMVKFLCAVVLYTLANMLMTGVFKMFNVNVVSLFCNCLSTVNATYSNVVVATSLCTYCLRVAVCFALFLSAVWMTLSIFVRKILNLATRCAHGSRSQRCLQGKVVNVATFSYKHHVAFLA